MMNQPQHVITLPTLEYQFLQEMITRVTREGLLIPDELPYAASVWTRIQQAQPVTPPPPEEPEDLGLLKAPLEEDPDA